MPFFAAAGLAVSAFSAFSSAEAGSEAAEAQERAWEMEQEMKKSAIEAQVDDINARRDEEYDAAADRMSELSRQALISRGRYAAAASDSGVAGTSASGIYMAAFLEEARARGHEARNFQSKNRQLNRDIRQAQAGLQIGKGPGAYDSTSDWLGFAADSLKVAPTLYEAYKNR